MLNLVPRLVSLNYVDGKSAVAFYGVVLVFDVTGFTSMAEARKLFEMQLQIFNEMKESSESNAKV